MKLKKGLQNYFSPQPLIRLEILRILLPLAILGFLSSRLLHADEWLTLKGFQIPYLGHEDWRQPIYLAPLQPAFAWGLAITTLLSGIFLSAGLFTRFAAILFTFCLGYLALADRLAAFTVSKLGVALALSLVFVPCGKIWSLDAFLIRDKKNIPPIAMQVSWGNVRFFQMLVLVMYCASGISKLKGDWLTHPYVLWTHMHDSYQTSVTYWVAVHFPKWIWKPLQYLVLAFETFAPLWFLLPSTRLIALCFGLSMHLFIGLCFGPVKWFAFLMGALLLGAFGNLKAFQNFFSRSKISDLRKQEEKFL